MQIAPSSSDSFVDREEAERAVPQSGPQSHSDNESYQANGSQEEYDSEEFSEDSTVNDEKLAIALKIFKSELQSEIKEATREIANEVAGETMDKMVKMIEDLKSNVIPMLT